MNSKDEQSLKFLEDLATIGQQSFMVTGCKFYKTQAHERQGRTLTPSSSSWPTSLASPLP